MAMKDNHDLYLQLRQRYPVFSFEGFSYELEGNDLLLHFDFRVGSNIRFSPTSRIKYHKDFNGFYGQYPLSVLEPLIFSIGMIEMVSYWKATCSPVIHIKAGALDKKAIEFWKKLFFNGLGEFFYVNNIQANMDDFVRFETDNQQMPPKLQISLSEQTIVPIGGGKDSVVTLELLRKSENIIPIIMNPRGATTDCAKIAGFENDFFEIERKIDARLLDLNAQGFLNGHTPFSAMLAFYCVLLAVLSGRKNIALSNENSANEATVIGTAVNHQYSKSFEFEQDFRNYVAAYLHDEVNYYSFLRPIAELQIAFLFAQQKDYFPVFKSCNVGSKTNQWCANCAKCLFSFIILSPFVDKDVLSNIYGNNLFDNESLLPYLKELCGLTAIKPFECVGTVEEVCLALTATVQRYQTLPPLLQFFVKTELYQVYKEKNFASFLLQWNEAHNLTTTNEILLKQALNITE